MAEEFLTVLETRCMSNRYYINLLTFNDSNKQRETLLQAASNEQARCLIEIVGNLVYGNIESNETELKQLRKKTDLLIKIFHHKTTSLDQKRKLLILNSKTIFRILDISRDFIEEHLSFNNN